MSRLPRSLPGFCGLMGLTLLCGTAMAGPLGPRPAVAIASLKTSPSLTRDREALELAVVRGMTEAGFDVQAPVLSQQRLAARTDVACSADTCLRQLADLTATRYLIQGEIASSKRSYSASFKLFDTTDGRQLASETIECRLADPCPPVADNVYEVARELGRKAQDEIGRAPPPAPPPIPAPAVPRLPDTTVKPPAAGDGPLPYPPPPTQRPERHVPVWRWAAPAAVAAVGVAGVAWGIHLLRIDGGTACDDNYAVPCAYKWSTGTRGTIFTVGGSLLVAGAGVDLVRLWWKSSRETTVGLVPGGVTLMGRF